MLSTFDMGAVLLLLAAAIGIANERTLRLPRPVALLLGSFVILAAIVTADLLFGHALRDHLRSRIAHAHLPQILLDGAIALLLFAGSLEVDLHDLRQRAAAVFALSTASVVLATVFFGLGIWAALQLIGDPVPLGWCFVAGAILAPTDAVAVEGLLARVRLPPGLHATIAGESLFNDGAAVVLFGTALALAHGNAGLVGHGRIAEAILVEGLGGVVLGCVAGYLGYRIIRLTRDDSVATTTSLALALAAYRAAAALDVSGPIAVVFAGMVLGSALSRGGGREKHVTLFAFWPLVDETLNTFLYLLIGFEVLAVDWSWQAGVAVAAAVPLGLAARLLSVGLPLLALRLPQPVRATGILTWAGLRGGISIALALILPESPYRNLLLTVCFGVVIFSVVVQGLLLPRVVAALSGVPQNEPTEREPSRA